MAVSPGEGPVQARPRRGPAEAEEARIETTVSIPPSIAFGANAGSGRVLETGNRPQLGTFAGSLG